MPSCTPTSDKLTCPRCGADSAYKYGRTMNGTQRYLCLVCGRQYSKHVKRHEIHDKPPCPVCHKHMNIYKREALFVRFRCSAYPQCKTYKKIAKEELLPANRESASEEKKVHSS